MKQDGLISVIVPVYNVEAYLPRCVESILAQTYGKLEIILVDDGTKDNSGAICDAYARQDDRIRVIHKPNGGLSSARNAGIDAAAGEYLSFVDSDDWIEPDMYEQMMALMGQYGVRLVCAGRWDVSSETGEKVQGLCPPSDEVISGEELVRRIFHWDNVDSAAWDKLYHRSLFATVRYPLGVICEDVPTTYRIALDAGQAAMLSRPVYNYYHRPGSITAAAVSEKTFHFSAHTAEIYPYIRENYPEIEDAARYLRVRSLAYNLLTLDLAGEDARRTFAKEYRQSRKELRGHIPFLLKSPLFGRQERATDLLLACGLYRPLRQVYHKFK
ncbi:MAG: glycosyltransferase family 2 protein [Faecousia sp.]